jgi:hypothetical protein
VLQRLHDEVPTDHFTLGWLMHRLRKRSFGIVMLLLALVAIAPGVSIVAGLLLMIPAFQMIAGQPAPVFPHRIAARPLPKNDARAKMSVPVCGAISDDSNSCAVSSLIKGTGHAYCMHRDNFFDSGE